LQKTFKLPVLRLRIGNKVDTFFGALLLQIVALMGEHPTVEIPKEYDVSFRLSGIYDTFLYWQLVYSQVENCGKISDATKYEVVLQ
jgi:hypothetical protein